MEQIFYGVTITERHFNDVLCCANGAESVGGTIIARHCNGILCFMNTAGCLEVQ